MLAGNHFSGFIPNQLCQLNEIGLLDLSRNSFSGSIPAALVISHLGKLVLIIFNLDLLSHFWEA